MKTQEKIEFSLYELGLIRQALVPFFDEWCKEVEDFEAKGKRHIFTQNYIRLMQDELSRKLTALSEE